MKETSGQGRRTPESSSPPNLSMRVNFSPQGRPQPMCTHIMKNRDVLFQDLSFEQCVALGYLVRLIDWTNMSRNGTSDSEFEIPTAIRVAQSALDHLNSDISKAWLVFLRSQGPDHYALVLLEAAFYFAHRHEASLNNRGFKTQCEKHLNRLDHGLRKRKETVELPTAESAKMSELHNFLGSFLCTALKRGRQRQEEVTSNFLSLTRGVELKFGNEHGEDFILLVSVASFAQHIVEDALRSPDDLRDVVGIWLFDAMKISKASQESITRCVQIFLHDNEEDVVLEIKIGFLKALELARRVFPMYP